MQTETKNEPATFITAVCTTCGAHRPKVEIDHRACLNCQNLDQMKAAIDNQAAAEEAAKKAEAEGKETLKNLPDLDKPASSLYDNERGVWWLGIDLKKRQADAPVAMMIDLDQAKMHLLAALMDWQRREQAKAKLIIRAQDSVKVTVQEIMRKGTEKAMAVGRSVKDLFAIQP